MLPYTSFWYISWAIDNSHKSSILCASPWYLIQAPHSLHESLIFHKSPWYFIKVSGTLYEPLIFHVSLRCFLWVLETFTSFRYIKWAFVCYHILVLKTSYQPLTLTRVLDTSSELMILYTYLVTLYYPSHFIRVLDNTLIRVLDTLYMYESLILSMTPWCLNRAFDTLYWDPDTDTSHGC